MARELTTVSVIVWFTAVLHVSYCLCMNRGQWHGDVAIKMLHMDPDTDNAAQLSAFKLEVKAFRKIKKMFQV